MTVRELIDELGKFDNELEVYFDNWESVFVVGSVEQDEIFAEDDEQETDGVTGVVLGPLYQVLTEN